MNKPALEVWLHGESLPAKQIHSTVAFCSSAERIQHPSHYCIHVASLGQATACLSFLQCLRGAFFHQEDAGSWAWANAQQVESRSVRHTQDTGVDDIYRPSDLELFIGIKWRRAEFEIP